MPIRPTLRAQIRWLSTITIAVAFVANGQAQSDIRATVYASGFTGPVAIVQHP